MKLIDQQICLARCPQFEIVEARQLSCERARYATEAVQHKGVDDILNSYGASNHTGNFSLVRFTQGVQQLLGSVAQLFDVDIIFDLHISILSAVIEAGGRLLFIDFLTRKNCIHSRLKNSPPTLI